MKPVQEQTTKTYKLGSGIELTAYATAGRLTTLELEQENDPEFYGPEISRIELNRIELKKLMALIQQLLEGV